MSEYTEHAPGTFCWAELISGEAEGAKKFYGELFGWESHDDPVGPDQVYTMLSLGGKPVGALYQRNAQQESQGVPPHWGSYISVEDVEATTAKAKELGAAAILEPMDVMDVGRMAVLQDPKGATFCLWQPKQHVGALIKNEPNSLCWNELLTTDTDAAGAFYSQLFDWGSETKNYGEIKYTSFMKGQEPAGGMMEIQSEWGPVPPHWMVYFQVEDCDAAAQKADAAGGTIAKPPEDIPGVGRFAMVQDPSGAMFSIIKLDDPR